MIGILSSWTVLSFALLFGAMDSSYVTPRTVPAPPGDDPIQLQLDTSEAEAVLAILERIRAHQLVEEGTWARVFSSEPYRRLKQRETQMQRAFTDSAFRRFVASPALLARADSLRRTLRAWSRADLTALARRVMSYLPDSALIRAHVYPVIKPQTNSFVFEPSTNAAIFLYLDPTEGAAQFENTVAHELHHIGFGSVSGSQEAMRATLSPGASQVVEWMGAFGEGLAMLAAAGGPDVHPHASSPAADRARWDRDMGRFDDDLRALERFFTGILDRHYKSEAEVQKAGYSFFGVQGPWYTVGYRMAVMVERRFGRQVLIECMLDPRELLARYNAAAADSMRAGHATLATWSPEFLRRLGTRGY